MNISGIVCEYNPFHNGHAYHIEKTRENGATHIVAVMSGNFVQRGDVAVLDKFTRANLAVRCGADLVIELPVVYSLAPAEIFARGAVFLLDSLGVVDGISFGSECGDVERLRNAVNIFSAIDPEDVRRRMKSGETYPKAVCSIMKEADPFSADIISSPNNLLAVEYMKSLEYFGSDMKPFTVKRSGADHDSAETADFSASASYIRANPGTARLYCPDVWAEALRGGNVASFENLERVILYKIRTVSDRELSAVSDITDGLIQRISGNRAESLGNLLGSVKAKCFTMARIRRIILSMLIGITKEDAACLPPYARILAFNEKGREILALVKKNGKIPVGTSLAKLGRADMISKRFSELEAVSSDVYSIAKERPTAAGEDYKANIKESK